VTAFGADLGVGLAEIFVPGAASSSTTAYTLGCAGRLRDRRHGVVVVAEAPAAPPQLAPAARAVAAGRRRRRPCTPTSSAPMPAAPGTTLLTLGLVAVGSYPLALRLIGVARTRLIPAVHAAPAVVVPDDLAELDVDLQPERELVGAGR
jgi:hypothetical protein